MANYDNVQSLGVVQELTITDGSQSVLSMDRQGTLKITNSRARFAEATSRGRVFSVSTSVTGVTVTAAMVAPPAAAAVTFLSLYNPYNNTKDFEVLVVNFANISGTPGVGVWSYCISTANTAALTASANLTVRAQRSGSSTAQCYSNTALTGGLVHVVARVAPISQFGAAIASGTAGLVAQDILDGSLIVAPGQVLTLAAPATGTSHIAAASITWQEVAISGVGG